MRSEGGVVHSGRSSYPSSGRRSPPLADRRAVVRIILLGALAAAGLGLGVVAARQPLAATAAALALLLAASAVAARVLRLPLYVVGTWGVVAFHYVTVLKMTWIDQVFPLFKFLRLFIGLGLMALLLSQAARFLQRAREGRSILLPIAYAAWVPVSALWSPAPAHSGFYGLWLLLIVGVVSLAVVLADDPSWFWDRWLAALVMGGALLTAASLGIAWLGLEQASNEVYILGEATTGARGLFISANHMGAVACLALAAAFARRLLRRSGGWSVGLVALAGLAAVAAVASLSRSAAISLLLAILTYFVLGRGGGSSRSFRTLSLLIVIAVVSVALARSEFAARTFDRFTETQHRMARRQEVRLHVWRAYSRGYLEKPLTGTGFMYMDVEGGFLARRVTGGAVVGPHSALIEYGLTTGLPGTLLFAAALVVAAIRLGRAPPPIRAAVIQVVVAMAPQYLAQAMTAPGSWGPFVLWVPLVFCGSLDGTPADEERHPLPDPEAEPGK